MSVDRLLWIFAFLCFALSFLRTLFGTSSWGRVELISLGLALASLTFII